jgi:hypothetical protein
MKLNIETEMLINDQSKWNEPSTVVVCSSMFYPIALSGHEWYSNHNLQGKHDVVE